MLIGCLIYMKSNSNVEYWPALLEKAYAKAKGTYELLNSWLPIDACIELTGGCPERVKHISNLLKGWFRYNTILKKCDSSTRMGDQSVTKIDYTRIIGEYSAKKNCEKKFPHIFHFQK